MTIQAKIIKDSVAPSEVRLTTFLLTYPRFIHSEVMTHRAFSRNASSSRAIPFKRQIKAIREDMAKPLAFLANQKGMQGGIRLPRWKETLAFGAWWFAGQLAILAAIGLDKLGAHKQYVNRLIEPFSHITVVLTGVDEAFANFFALRFHPDAQPEIAKLAQQMHLAYVMSTPQKLPAGFWHLPFIGEDVIEKSLQTTNPEHLNWIPLIKVSVAACARTSYNNHDGTDWSFEKDEKLHDSLLTNQPMHASPAEHQAMATEFKSVKSGNFHGWVQYRKTLPGEYITTFNKPLKSFK